MWTDDANSKPRPSIALATGDAIVIGAESGSWWTVAGDELVAIESTGAISAAVCAGGVAAIASWDSRLQRLQGGAWSAIALAAPAIAAAATPRGLVIADTAGGLSLIAGASQVPVQELVADEPIAQLAAAGDGLAALHINGTVSATAWPAPTAEARLGRVDTSAIGRAHALLPWLPSRPGALLVAGARGVGVLDGARLVAITTDLGERVAGCVPFAATAASGGCALLYSEDGAGYLVDRSLARTSSLAAIGAIAGAAPHGHAVLAWTIAGALYEIASDGAHARLAAQNVVLAAPDVGRLGAIAVHWTPTGGARVTRGHGTWT